MNRKLTRRSFGKAAAIVPLSIMSGCLFGCTGTGQTGEQATQPSETAVRKIWVVTREINNELGAERSYEYDSSGNLSVTRYLIGSTNVGDVTTFEATGTGEIRYVYDNYGNPITITDITRDSEDEYTDVVQIENEYNQDGYLTISTFNAIESNIEKHHTNTYEYYDDGTLKQQFVHYEWEPEEDSESDIVSLHTRFSDSIYSYDGDGYLLSLERIQYQYDNIDTPYDSSIEDMIRRRTVSTYTWLHDSDGFIQGVTVSSQDYDYLGDDQYLANYEPDIFEYELETDDYSNPVLVIATSFGETEGVSYQYKLIDSTTNGAYTYSKRRDWIYGHIALM